MMYESWPRDLLRELYVVALAKCDMIALICMHEVNTVFHNSEVFKNHAKNTVILLKGFRMNAF